MIIIQLLLKAMIVMKVMLKNSIYFTTLTLVFSNFDLEVSEVLLCLGF